MKPYNRKKIESHTYGNFNASERLAEILNEVNNGYITQKVGRFLETYLRMIKGISTIEDLVVREESLKLIYSRYKLLLRERRYEYVIESHVLNVMNAYYRQIFGVRP